jgi:hypothetical protein
MHNESLHSLLENVWPNILVHFTDNKIIMDVKCLGRMTNVYRSWDWQLKSITKFSTYGCNWENNIEVLLKALCLKV